MMTLNNSSETPKAAHFVPKLAEVDEASAKLKATLLHNIQRSAYVYRVDCGGCNGCEIEIFASITSLFDAERFGIKVVPSPRHADILVFTGSVTRAMRMPALRAFYGAPDPKICVSYGACGCGGGIFHDLYCVWGGSDKIVPIDVYIPGCPPTPGATIYGFAMALGLLGQKLKEKNHVEAEGDKSAVAHPGAPLDVRVKIERQARLLAGYVQGRQISDQFVDLLEKNDLQTMPQLIEDWCVKADDPRLRSIVTCLKETLDASLNGEAARG
jgi:hydrogenase-4 component I